MARPLRPLPALAAAALLAGAGCASIGSVQTADTLGKDNLEVSFEPGMQALVADPTVVPQGAAQYYPHVDLAVRYGVTDRIDLGGRVGFSFVEFQSKFLLTDPHNGWLAMSLAPALGGLWSDGSRGLSTPVGSATLSKGGIVNLALPLLVGIKLGRHELTLGPRLQNNLIFFNNAQGDGVVYILGAGGSVGFSISLFEYVRLMPEVSVVPTLYNSAGASPATVFSTVGQLGLMPFFQAKLGIMFGKRGHPLPRADVPRPRPAPPPPPATPAPAVPAPPPADTPPPAPSTDGRLEVPPPPPPGPPSL